MRCIRRGAATVAAAWLWAALLPGVAGHAAPAEPMRILTADIPPLAYVQEGRVMGFCVDVVREIQRRTGDSTEITAMPWARSYRLSRSGANVVLVCPKRIPEREQQFLWVGPLRASQTNFYVRRGAGVHLASMDDARKLSGVLVQRDFYSHQYLRGEGFDNLEPVNSALSMLRMLMAGRRPAMVIDRDSLPALLAQAHVDPAEVELALPMLAISSYITFSRGADPQVVARWRTALEQIKSDGTFARIEQRWLPPTPPMLPAPHRP